MAKTQFAREHLRSFIERVERLEEERTALTADIREVYAEAKGQGFDTKIMREIVRLRKMETADRQEQEAMRDLYMGALGMLADTPLGQASITKATVEALQKMPRRKPLPPRDPVTAGETATNSNAGLSECALTTQGHSEQGATVDDMSSEPAAAMHGGSRTPGESVCVTGGESAAHSHDQPDIPAFLDRRRERQPEHA